MDYSITDEHTNNTNEGIRIVRMIKIKISKLYGDKRYDSKAIYNELEDKAAIPPRRNAVTLSRGSPYRAKITRFIRRFSEGLWKVNNNYGMRWNVEIYFCGIKRMFGETIRAVKPENIVQEMMLKVLVCPINNLDSYEKEYINIVEYYYSINRGAL